MRWFQFTAAMLFGITLPVYPQAGDSAGQADQIQSLLSRIDRLERRMADLEKELAAASPSARPSQDVRPAAHSAHPDVSAADPGREINYPSLKIAGFSDINFAATDQRGTRSGFNEGQFILHLNSNLAPKVTFLGELSLSARSDAGTGTPAATGFNASNAPLSGSSRTIISKLHSAATTPRSITGIRNSIMASGCKPRSAGRRWFSSAAGSFRCTLSGR
jgi:hypothetical protein